VQAGNPAVGATAAADQAPPASAQVIARWAELLRRSNRAGISRAVHGVADRKDVTGELKNITVPTLVAVGDEDVPTPPAAAEQIATAIGQARLEIITGAGHSSPLEQPGAVTALLRDFLASAE
jgi:3-oxoadipate enol-lactonase